MPPTSEAAASHANPVAPADVEAACREALAREPHNGAALHLRGMMARHAGRYPEAIEFLAAAAATDPATAAYHHDLGEAHRAGGEPQAALPHYERAIALRPAYADAFVGLGRALEMLGRPHDARPMYRWAVALEPDHAEAHVHLGRASLLLGDHATGWAEHEWRHRVPERAPACPPAASLARWDGSDPAGRTILVYCERGAGDCIQFARYLPLLSGRRADVVLTCPPALVRLFGGLPGVRVVAEGEVPPRADLCVAIGSLPLLFGTTPATIPTFAAYLRPAAARSAAWRERLRPLRTDGRALVGLACGDDPASANDCERSPRLTDLSPLAAARGVRFVSIQAGLATTFDAPHAQTGPDLVDLSLYLHDVAEAAAAVSQLDLVVTADPIIAHLAGALGKPVWTLVPFAADWPWGSSGDDTPWYPAMRLFRQATAGDWSDVIAEVLHGLKGLRADAGKHLAA